MKEPLSPSASCFGAASTPPAPRGTGALRAGHRWLRVTVIILLICFLFVWAACLQTAGPGQLFDFADVLTNFFGGFPDRDDSVSDADSNEEVVAGL